MPLPPTQINSHGHHALFVDSCYYLGAQHLLALDMFYSWNQRLFTRQHVRPFSTSNSPRFRFFFFFGSNFFSTRFFSLLSCLDVTERRLLVVKANWWTWLCCWTLFASFFFYRIFNFYGRRVENFDIFLVCYGCSNFLQRSKCNKVSSFSLNLPEIRMLCFHTSFDSWTISFFLNFTETLGHFDPDCFFGGSYASHKNINEDCWRFSVLALRIFAFCG